MTSEQSTRQASAAAVPLRTYICEARRDVATPTTCNVLSSRPVLNERFCTPCACPWRLCRICITQNARGPESFVTNPDTGLCDFHTEHGTEAVRPRNLEADPAMQARWRHLFACKRVAPEEKYTLTSPGIPGRLPPQGKALPGKGRPSVYRPSFKSERLTPNQQLVLEHLCRGARGPALIEAVGTTEGRVTTVLRRLRKLAHIPTENRGHSAGHLDELAHAYTEWKERHAEQVIDAEHTTFEAKRVSHIGQGATYLSADEIAMTYGRLGKRQQLFFAYLKITRDFEETVRLTGSTLPDAKRYFKGQLDKYHISVRGVARTDYTNPQLIAFVVEIFDCWTDAHPDFMDPSTINVLKRLPD